MKMENITFDNLPQAIALLLEKMEKLEQMLCGRAAETRIDQKPMGVKEAAAFLEIRFLPCTARYAGENCPHISLAENYILMKRC